MQVRVTVWHRHAPHGGQERASDPQELELQVDFEPLEVGIRNPTLFLCKSSRFITTEPSFHHCLLKDRVLWNSCVTYTHTHTHTHTHTYIIYKGKHS